MSSAGYKGITTLTHLECARNNDIAAPDSGGEGGRDEDDGKGGMHVEIIYR